MADNRLELHCNGESIVIAVRHGYEWRSAKEPGNDIGDFLNRIKTPKYDDEQIHDLVTISYEHEPESISDPMFVSDSKEKGNRDIV